ncbi:glycosyltransferase family 32 protein [Breznakiella homolactica]|uniref:Glycosyl transferase n=1 Tax=Breznakiella homolactica TaxID=2798577 RepID=A0A7T7XNY2_9SPIR|nr:glycosyltransferase [Breznakiella homolactica]QQO09819.1 hypothetical protein JFL75_02605 [Breznakiella homolactica]
MIPEKVHYCWLSGSEYDLKTKKCLESWKKNLKNYDFFLWTMQNLPIEVINSESFQYFVRKKLWAFAADYVRIWALKEFGGIYLDMDVEVLKDFRPLLEKETSLIIGIEGTNIGGHFIAAIPNNIFIDKVFTILKSKTNLMPLPVVMRQAFDEWGEKLIPIEKEDLLLLPAEYFNPFLWDEEKKSGELKTTKNTYCIHWYRGSWIPRYKKNFLYKKLVFFLDKMGIISILRKIRGF